MRGENIMKKRSKILLIMLIATLALSGCKKTEPEKKVVPNKKEETTKEEKNEELKEKKDVVENENLLTGLSTLSKGANGKRPVAVMINNVEPAMPQYGVEQADIIFEIPVEGDLTRFMALYGDYTKVPDICAIRSCRYYFPIFAKGFDAFYTSWGADPTIIDYVKGLDIEWFDGMEGSYGLFGRDENRLNSGYALEHTGIFYGTQVANAIDDNGLRTELSEDHARTAFSFCKLDEHIKPQGEECIQVSINFGNQTADLIYDVENGLYKKQMNGHPQIDGKTGNQLSFTNIFVLETDISVRDEIGHKKIECMGGNTTTAYYISNGTMQKIHWKKDGGTEDSRLVFFDDSGKEIVVNRGKTYIAVNYPLQTSFQ